MRNFYLIVFFLGFNLTYGQQYDVYVGYFYRSFDAPIDGMIWNRTGSGNVFVRDEDGNTVINFSKTFETANRGRFEDAGTIAGTTDSPTLRFNSEVSIDTSPQSFRESDNTGSLDGTGTSGYQLTTEPGWYFSGLVSKRERISISIDNEVLCYKDKITIAATNGHPIDYQWEFKVGREWIPFGTSFATQEISLTDLFPSNPEAYINVPVQFRVYNPLNDYYADIVTYSWIGCSIELRDNDPVQKTNATCNGDINGSVTLNFKENVELGYEMRYYIYEGDPASFPTGQEENPNPDSPSFPQTVDNVRFSTGSSPNQVGPMESNGDGTYRGQSKSNLGSGTYYVLYQEVRYDFPNPGDVDVKSGRLIPESFDIDEPSPILAAAAITQPTCEREEAIINFSASGGDDFDPTGSYRFEYRLDGGDWEKADGNSASVAATSDSQNVEVRAFFVTGPDEECESDEVLLDDVINAIPPQVSFSNLSSDTASSPSSNDGFISANYEGGVPTYSFLLERKNGSSYAGVENPSLIHNVSTQLVEFQDLGVGTYRIIISDGRPCSFPSEDIEVGLTPPPAIASEEVVPISCSDNGSITVGISGGVAPYNYRWIVNGTATTVQTTRESSVSLNNISEPGEYIFQVASNGFTNFDDTSGITSTTLNLGAPEEVVINSATANDISCNGAADGSIVVNATGATDYEYRLDAFDDWQTLNGNTIPITTGGFYELYLRNAENGCEADPILNSLLVAEPDELVVVEDEDAHDDVSINGGNDGSLAIAVSGGTPGSPPEPAYEYLWTGPDGFTSTSQNITSLSAGDYSVTVTDSEDCTQTLGPLTISEPGPIAINAVEIQQEVSCATADDGSISADVTGEAPLTFEWSRNGNPYQTLTDENVLTGLPPGDYQLLFSDASGAPALQSEVITLVAPVAVTAEVASTGSCSGAETGTIAISNVEGGTLDGDGSYTYSINDGASFQNSPEFEDLAPGNYTVRVRDANGCDFIALDFVVAQFSEIVWDQSGSEITGVSAAGLSDGAISPVFTGGVPPYTYTWEGPGVDGETSREITGLGQGTFTVSVTDTNGCDLSQAFELTEPGEFTVSAIASAFLECNGDDTAEITATIQGGVQPYDIAWFEVANSGETPLAADTETIGNLTASTYLVRVTDSNGISTESDPITITEPDELIVTENLEAHTDVTTSGGNDGALSIFVSGGTPGTTPAPEYQYSWSGPDGYSSFSQNITDLSAGNYTVTVTDANGCPQTLGPINVSEPGEFSVSAIATNLPECNGDDAAQISASIQGGVSPYSIVWLEIQNGREITLAEVSETIDDLSAGSYLIRVTDSNGITAKSDPVTITEPDELVVTENLSAHLDVTVNGANDGALGIIVSGGNPGIPPSPDYQYEWVGPDGYASTSKDITGLSAGNYTVTVTDTNGCSQSFGPINISEPGTLALNDVGIQTEISCAAANDGVLFADVSGDSPVIFEWIRDGNPYRTLTDENLLTDVPPGDYQLFLSDASGTPALESETITLEGPIAITADVVSTGTCSGTNAGTIAISNVGGGTPGVDQDYTYGIDNVAAFQNEPLFENLAPGNYTVRVRDANGCDFIATDISVAQFPEITWDQANSEIIGVTAAGRSDGAISPVFSGGIPPFSYSWEGPNVDGETIKDLTGLTQGSFVVTVSDANACSFEQSFTITQPGELVVSIATSVLLECNGDDFAEIVATVQGGVAPYSFEWFEVGNGSGTSLPEETETIGNLSAGNYRVTVTDANGVVAESAPLEIVQPGALEIEIDNTIDVLCSGETTGAVAVSVSGGTLPYTYTWSTGDTGPELTNVPAGEYFLDVVDANGCFSEITATVNAAPDAVRIENASITSVSEYLAEDGGIALDIVGGSPPYTVAWTNLTNNTDAGNQANLSNLSAGNYRVSISDSNGCSLTETYEITQPDIVEETIVPPTCKGQADGSISVLVNEGNGIFAYTWNTGATGNSVNNLAAGSYEVTITGLADGPQSRTYVLEDPAPLEVDLGEDRTLCAGQELELDATVEDISASYSWTSDNGFTSTDPTVTLTQTGNYMVTITNSTGCTAEGQIFIDISTDEIDAEFAVSSQVFVNETFTAVDISYPLPDGLEWILPDEATVLKENDDEVELRFDTPGEYDIEILTMLGDCFAQKTKKIIVVAADGTVPKEDTASGTRLIEDFLVYPNPTDGKFTADVHLTEKGNISIKVFSLANNALMDSIEERSESDYSIPFDISTMPTGVYAVLLETPYGNTLRKIILK